MIKVKGLGAKAILLFFLIMLILPASFQLIRGIFLLLITVFSLRKGLMQNLRYNKTVVFLGLINIVASLFFISNGLAFSAPGALSVSTVYFIWPILYLYFIGYNSAVKDIIPSLDIILYGGIISAILVLIFILNSFISLPFIQSIANSQDFSIGIYDGFIELNSMNLATVLYAFSFSLTFLLLPKEIKNFTSKRNRRLNIICLVLSIILILISARRAFWLVCFLSPVITVMLFKISGIKINLTKYIIPAFGLLIFISIAFMVLSLDLEVLESQFGTILEFNDPAEESNYLRKEQYEALINGWKVRPIIGNGLGAAASGSIRDDKAPWAYELSYLALLFQTGIVGILIYGGSIFWIFYKGITIIKYGGKLEKLIMAPQLTSLACFLIANATNPYLAKFDYLWTIFLPLASINAFSIYKNNNQNNLKIENIISNKIS